MPPAASSRIRFAASARRIAAEPADEGPFTIAPTSG
jgi:hypothetical protein